MKRLASLIFSVLLLISCAFTYAPAVAASPKATEARTIAIVFDNSGSMYVSDNQAWCRATYAMEVFASMLNEGDTLLIYPMHPITVGGNKYTMQDPYKITDASMATTIRDIFTEDAGGTPIESIDCAITGLQQVTTGQKHLIILTDGGTFSKGGGGLTKVRTVSELDKRIQAQAGINMNVMYLGIGSDACLPDTKASESFTKALAENSEDVLSTLTDMCNKIFGRDTLPKSRVSGNNINFDISMKKLIVFVQGENISDLKISGGSVGNKISSRQTMYSTAGAGDYKSVADTSLQGMMVTYADCGAGSYTIDYSGTATSIEVYYEPNADLDFVFTDTNGNNVSPSNLYEGDYKVSFGMKDAKTGKLIESDLLGKPHYQGSYTINGTEYQITHDGYSGEVPLSLKMSDSLEADLTVTYLGGYTITKDSSDFGWPEEGIEVVARPAGELRLEISGGDSKYQLQDLEKGSPYTAKVYYEGVMLTGDELESVDLKWNPDTSNAEIKQNFADDHFELNLFYKDESSPQDTAIGECTVTIYAYYTPHAANEAVAECLMTYNIVDDVSPFGLTLFAPDDYIVISEIEDSKEITVNLTMDGKKMIPEEFAAVSIQVDCGGIEYNVTPDEQNSAYLIKLLPTDGISENDYSIKVTAEYTDHIGRTYDAEDEVTVTLSTMPLWLKWLIGLLLLLIIIIIILIIMHIRVLPKKAHITKRESTMIFDGEDESKSTGFDCSIDRSQMVLTSKYAGNKTGISMDVKPGKESYLKKPQHRRTAEVASASVRKIGNASIREVSIGSIKYVLNEDNNKLERFPKSEKPFLLKHGMPVSYTGTMVNGGSQKTFTVNTKLNFKKK